METDPSLWLPYSFFRRPEWRWLRAAFLIASGRRFDRRIDDHGVFDARNAQRGRGGRKANAIRAAHAIWTVDSPMKWELEALLLTEEPLDKIAVRCLLSLPTTEAYNEVFFAVRTMRKATDWLLARAVGYRPLTGSIGPLPAAAWKLAALTGGPLILDVVIAATLGRAFPEGVLKETGWRREIEEVTLRLAARLWVSSLAAVTDEAFARVVNAHQQLRDLGAPLCRLGTVSPCQLAMEKFLMRLPMMARKARRADGCALEMARGSTSTTAVRSTNTEPATGSILHDVHRVVDDVDEAIRAAKKARTDGLPRTTTTGGQATETKPLPKAA